MANNEKDLKKEREERVKKYRDTNALVTEETEGGDILKKPVFDILEYIENQAKVKGNHIAKKILKLREYGITDAQIIEYYKDGSSAIENEKTAISKLDTVFSRLVAFINNLPNGIVIDLETAEKNDDKSFDQAIKYGIYSEDSIVEELNDAIIGNLKEVVEATNFEKVDYLLENFKDIYIYNPIINREMGKDIDDILKKNENEMNLSDSLKSLVKDCKEIIENSPYEIDPHLFEICKMQAMLKGAKSSQDYNLLLSKVTAFYKEHPNYIGKALPIFNQDGSLNQEEIIKMNEYSESYQKLIILEHIDTFNDMTSQELANLDSTERKHMMMCAFSGLKYANDGNKKNQELVKESMKMIKQMYPNLDLNNGKQLADFFKEVSGIDANFESLSLQELIGIYSHQLKEATEDYLEKDTEAYIGKKIDFSKLDLDSSERKLFDSPMKNYFVGSNIKFTEKDEQEYNKLYQDVTIESWIETKENAIKLRYAALTTIRDEYKNNPVGTYTEKKLVEIERDIAEFESKYGKIDLTEKDGEVSFDVYREDFVKAGLTKYLTRDAREWSQGADYKNLSEEHKKGYIRNILVALDENKDPNSYMTKIALRRLELMGDDFVKFNPDGTFEINEDLILEEYKKLSDYNYPSYEQLAESAKLRKNEYLLKKLEEYTNLPENSFVELTNRNDPEASIAQIDEVRYLSNQKRIEQFTNVQGRKTNKNSRDTTDTTDRKVNKDDEKIADKDIFSSVKDGVLEVEVIKVSKDRIVATPQIPRDESRKDQEEQAGVNGESNATSEMKATTIDTTAVTEGITNNKNTKPSFIETVKNAFSKVKDAISKIIKNEEKPKELEVGRKELTEEEKKAKYEETFRPVDSSQTSRPIEVMASTPTPVRDEER